MNFFYVMNAKSIKTVFVIVIAAFFTAWFFYMDNMVQIPAFSAKDGPKAIYKGEKDLALTFNIGWGDEKAEPILDVLKKEKAGAVTFFLSGSWAERHPDLVNRMVKEGYEIGMLGYEYKDYTDLEEDKVRRDIQKAQEAFKKLNVKNIELLRAPTGHFDQRTLKIAERFGYTVVHWSLDTKDWTNPGTEVIAANASKAKKGDILLMHASDSAKQTAEALPLVLKDIRSKNLKMVTVSEMIANGESKSAEVK
ncbi:polysaccharide deacetylase family sporulation protein PdaB [Mesobacillus jeotgali]|jgi:peptidoglycan-N-acetylglucosamine deacetylase|uniref:Polysaccharide deacetylase family sporulation protein PdaB n=1 Tax=Mesobacillus jeotgali TaxID=129985 RepID=A0ABY9VGT7_9BACI|nr:polysaccharide deacetylase family sporulation protein PdaB [Mesobacillus jeotgali]WNF23142.1 polysaccharide deacetylase family sporulation protein PdaB [Mesobacillus jeotgali]